MGAKADFRAILGALGDPFWGSKIKKNCLEHVLKFDAHPELHF